MRLAAAGTELRGESRTANVCTSGNGEGTRWFHIHRLGRAVLDCERYVARVWCEFLFNVTQLLLQGQCVEEASPWRIGQWFKPGFCVRIVVMSGRLRWATPTIVQQICHEDCKTFRTTIASHRLSIELVRYAPQ